MVSRFSNISENIHKELLYHVKDASFFIKNPHISQCIDWRRTPNESNFWMSIPWGWIWQLAVILAVLEETVLANNPDFREKALEILFDVIWWKQNLSYHTDDHACDGEIWCGHISLLLEKKARSQYGLSDISADFIREVIETQKGTAILNVLHWGHKEVWILKIFSTHHSVHAHFDNKQFFIYTPKIAYIRNVEIAHKIYNEFIKWTSLSITAKTLSHMLQKKTDLNFYLTIHTLAPNLPVYRIKHSLNWSIKYMKKIAEKSIELSAYDSNVFDL